ncbi:hypothetical protein [Frigidibacter sp.]|uniref:hypothetical protein n=1 Tax=Frigidibacter sp. TaxID=2586418 RepID=UPI002734B216|nr:hypothetical protein [Frigidibacter sp.]MDP3339838.1 hypothetical protein [Frigidibacter sp.]
MHAVQATASARPILGRLPRGGSRNLLAPSEDLSNAAWVPFFIKPVVIASPDSISTVSATQRIVYDPTIQANRYSGFIRSMALIQGATYTLSFKICCRTRVPDNIIFSFGNNWSPTATVVIDGAGLPAANIGARLVAGQVHSVMLTYTHIGSQTLGSPFTLYFQDAVAGKGTANLDIAEIQSEISPAKTAYQTIVSQYDATQAGEPLRWYLSDDLVDDSLTAPLPSGTYTVGFANDAGVSILTGQAVTGTYSLPGPARLYGALAINRALSAAETAMLSAWLGSRRP